MFDVLIVETTSRRHDNDARAGIDGKGAVTIAVSYFEQKTRDGSSLHLNNKSPASGVFKDVSRVLVE